MLLGLEPCSLGKGLNAAPPDITPGKQVPCPHRLTARNVTTQTALADWGFGLLYVKLTIL